jgi:hypothetical protein
MEYIKQATTEQLKKMLSWISDNATLAFIRAELLKRGQL